jgi:hypothetical protein
MRRRWLVVYRWPDPPHEERYSVRMYYSEAINYVRIFEDAIGLEHTLGFRVPRRFIQWYTRPLLVLVLGLAVIFAVRCAAL